MRCGVLRCAGIDIGGSPYVVIITRMMLLLLMNNVGFDVVALCGVLQCVGSVLQ